MINLFRIFFVSFLMLLAGGQSRASAINDCIDACFNTASRARNEADGMNEGDCENGRDRCMKECNENISRGEAESPPVTGIYGAIAYDKNNGV